MGKSTDRYVGEMLFSPLRINGPLVGKGVQGRCIPKGLLHIVIMLYTNRLKTFGAAFDYLAIAR